MTELFTGKTVWPEIRRVGRVSRVHHVAVAYLGSDAPNLLPLRAGDTLVVDLSENTVRTGSTNVEAASRLLKRGVRLFTASYLHAKLFVFDNVILVGSANASGHSADTLVEAAARISNAGIAHAARQFVKALALRPVTPAYIKLCRQWWNESKPDRKRFRRAVRRRSPSGTASERYWLFSSVPYAFDTRRDDDKKAQQRILKPRQYVREPLAWTRPPRLTLQDQVIMAHQVGNRLEIFPPSRVLSFGKSKQGDSIVYVEQPREPRLAKEEDFRRAVRSAFKLTSKRIPTRRVPASEVPRFLALWQRGYSK